MDAPCAPELKALQVAIQVVPVLPAMPTSPLWVPNLVDGGIEDYLHHLWTSVMQAAHTQAIPYLDG